MRWRTTGASVTGRSHSSRGEAGQDSCRALAVQLGDTDVFLGLAADGAGSTTDGGTGAEIACTVLCERITETVRAGPDLAAVTDDTVRGWVAAARGAVEAEAAQKNRKLREYACTVLGAVAGGGKAVYFQIGDGAIVTGPAPCYRTVFWPTQGEYANTTFFLTDERYGGNLQVCHAEEPEEIAIFTDGLQNLVLSFAEKRAHAGFFSPLFAALRAGPGDGIGSLAAGLPAFLMREDIAARSDDDKTLVLAVRMKGG